MEGMIKSVANLIVYMHPLQTKNVDKAILRELSSLLFKYSQAFDGLVLAYSVETQDKCARILSGCEVFVHLLNAYFTEPNIEGKVVKLTRESIHCIVLGFSSAIVTDENIRNELKNMLRGICKQISQATCDKGWSCDSFHCQEGDMSNSLLHAPLLLNCVDSVILLRPIHHKEDFISLTSLSKCLNLINFCSLDEEIIHISGSLIPANTGSVHLLDKYYVDTGTDRFSTELAAPNFG
ncbi:hypothetical protein SADUNF_Sadunf02G0021100 [Salix dunnii]|uniref:Uncharacterized protein n=1 Tax=Salix dunnii TaxID=1413687 RepID=A0A835N5U4_9ROSI|nr:hypothetical protein SADUNF_Sadunf02G0021100 [Salix dunnii]